MQLDNELQEPVHLKVVLFRRFLLNARSILKNPLPFHHKNFSKYGDTFILNLGLGGKPIFSRDSGFAQYVLQKNQKNYTKTTIQTKDLAKYVGIGLLTAEGEHWRKQRRLIQPAFHKKKLANIMQAVQEAIDTEYQKITTDQPIDCFPIFNKLAFQTVLKSLFSGGVPEAQIDRLQFITEQAQHMLVRELRQPYLGWWFKLRGHIQYHIDLVEEARKILIELVQKRRSSTTEKDDLLDMLLAARYENGEPMKEAHLIDEILILFVAGHETTSNALTFTAQLLAQHPEVQEGVYRESVQASEHTTNSMDFIKACPYTKAVIEESMRLYPPAYFIDRENYEADSYKGIDIPKGSNLLFSIHEIHRHKALWDDPESFKPERFYGQEAKSHSGHYYPFGAGPRMCIGNNFAMFEMILAITTLVNKYTIDSKDTPIAIRPLITLKPKDAILVFRKR